MPGHGRIAAAFAAARESGRGAFVPYLTSGFPTPAESDRLAAALADEGADVVELGVPFSDPLADGPVIQRAGRTALEAGATLAGVLDQARRLRARGGAAGGAGPAIVLMSYLNPIIRHGVARFTAEASEAGVDGAILVDLPPEEEPSLWEAFDRAGIETITLVAPTTAGDRLATIAARARGFLYVVARLGVTGEGSGDAGVVPLLDRCRAATPLPRCVGFGITPGTDLAPYRGHAEGIVAGSCLLAPLLESFDATGEAGAVERERRLRETCRAFRARLGGWSGT